MAFVTNTLSPTDAKNLAAANDELRRTHALARQGAAGRKFMKDHSILGTFRRIEYTVSADGDWHPHTHEILVLDPSSSQMDAAAAGAAWRDRFVSKAHSQDIDALARSEDSSAVRRAPQDQWAVVYYTMKSGFENGGKVGFHKPDFGAAFDTFTGGRSLRDLIDAGAGKNMNIPNFDDPEPADYLSDEYGYEARARLRELDELPTQKTYTASADMFTDAFTQRLWDRF
ncbi:hypothetical protein B5808_15640 [Cnuibacter physcomitrellae]|uniref:Uncharacterized protein n=2 Tax=Cnuibacter physcomitrellae TaxID=1619308 RepID=A0A1X9LN02_9MICO|nr:hypothetical protein B5808_15640 [Cnuibacter physcomitrellae]